MRHIEMETWPRREHFRFLNAFDLPHLSFTANVDITAFRALVKEAGYSFTVATVYVLARAANAIPEFRQRIREEGVVEHDIVHPSTTILGTGDLFGFCDLGYSDVFSEFAAQAAEWIASVKAHPTVFASPGRDDRLYMTAIPWVSFTSSMHPLYLPADSVPRLAWGKYFREGNALKMPLGVQAHHALVDGLHVGRYYLLVQELLSHPADVLGGAISRG